METTVLDLISSIVVMFFFIFLIYMAIVADRIDRKWLETKRGFEVFKIREDTKRYRYWSKSKSKPTINFEDISKFLEEK